MLEEIVAKGNRGHVGFTKPSKITCADGFTVSVIAGGGTYCWPRPALCLHLSEHEFVHEPDGVFDQVVHDYPGPYEDVEVGFPSERPEPWDEWSQYVEDDDKPTESVYARVPVDMVRELVALHGGELDDGALKF